MHFREAYIKFTKEQHLIRKKYTHLNDILQTLKQLAVNHYIERE
jgi:hypothetical protein